MLTKQIRQQIEDFVHQSPRTVQELAHHIDKNWRTADRYVQQISEEFGTIATKTFREGSRGALKLVYWNAIVGMKGTSFQDRLKTLIEAGKNKYDFSPMNIYQFSDPTKREAFVSTKTRTPHFIENLESAKQQILVFSGNLSWINEEKTLVKVLEKIIKRGVKIKFLTKIDLTSQEIANQLLKLNSTIGDDLISIRHCEQPLRCIIIDDHLTTIKEVYSPNQQREIVEKTFIYYAIKDSVWISWLQKIFWHLWEQSIDAQLRIDAMKTIRREKQ